MAMKNPVKAVVEYLRRKSAKGQLTAEKRARFVFAGVGLAIQNAIAEKFTGDNWPKS